MLAEERRAILLQRLKDNGYIEVTDVAPSLNVSAATVRRDLECLAQEGLVTRTRGGAVLSVRSTTLELPYDVKRQRHIEEKRRIAAAAAEMVLDGETIILDAGSTTYELALLLLHKRNLTVVTNDLQIAVKLASNPNINLVCTGGIARANVYTLLGPQVEAFLRTLRVNKTFLGADAIHPDGTIANVNLEEVAVKQAMVRAGEQVILLTDSSKFGIVGFAKVCDLSEVDVLITDRGIPPAMLERLREAELTVELV
ncbi:MAG: DeoR/GlpR transcriptional regulator [Chloroflexi bacterium]|nr:DeoR/GlpR transcriptional regulator [Chloroflexota bacterium]